VPRLSRRGDEIRRARNELDAASRLRLPPCRLRVTDANRYRAPNPRAVRRPEKTCGRAKTESVGSRDVELAATVVAGDDRINRRDRETHEDALSLLARECPVAGDLRLVAAPLDIIRCVERMGELVRSQVSQAEQAFDTRDVALARELV